MRLPNLKGKGAAGFTLVEMAIVLVIIGIILAGVMKGRDIVRGAQVKQFSQQFAQKWGTIAQTYYDKTGRVLNDGTGNGGAGTLDGAMDGALGDSINTANTGVLAILNRVGITPCTLIKSKLTTDLTTAPPQSDVAAPASCRGQLNLVATTVEGEYTGPINVQVDLANLFIERTDSAAAANVIERRNCVVLYQVPTDVAMGLDTAIDGTENGAAGSFVNLADNGTGRAGVASLTSSVGNEIAAIAWPDAVEAQNHVCAIVLDF